MKSIFKYLLVVIAVVFLVNSCKKPPVVTVEYLDITANNLAGKWELVELNGAKLQPGSYVHIEFIRKDSKFKIEQNVDSFGTTIHQVTGEFNLVDEPGIGVVMYGSYDNEEGLWAYSYIVSELTKDSVKFTAKDDNNYVQIFHRLN